MLEVLLLTSCLTTEPTCGPAAKAYYASKPYISRSFKRAKNKAVAYTGTWILYAGPAIALTRSEGKAQFRLARNLTIQLRQNETYVTFDMEF